MKHLLPSDAWRSEAFAEDLFEDDKARAPSPRMRHTRLTSNLIGLLPVVLAVGGVLLVTLRG